MLTEVRISDVGVISAAVLELGPGFTAITGETGAGKTMVLTGLAMLRGSKVDPSLVRRGASRAVAEGRWSLSGRSPLAIEVAERVTSAGGEIDDEELLVTRAIRPTGRGRCALGGCAVPTAVLAEVVDQLIAVHGQNDQLRLGRSQLNLLDRWAGAQVSALLAQYRPRFQRLRDLHSRIAEAQAAAAQRAARIEFLEYQLKQIDRVRPVAGEDAELAGRAERLGHAEVLGEAVTRAAELLAGGEGPDDTADVMSLLSTARRAVDSVRSHDPALDGPWATLGEAAALVGDAAAELHAYAAGVESDPEQLATVEARRAEIGKLVSRFGPTLTDVLDWESAAASELSQLAGLDSSIAAWQSEAADVRGELGLIAQQLHEARVDAAERFGTAVAAELAALAMPAARLRVQVTISPDPQGLPATLDQQEGTWQFGNHGCDEAVMLLAANPGAPWRPVAQGASGGELSRIMLAVHVVLAGADPVPTMVFDEVDAGVGGAAALEVGRRLARLAQATQVIVVTHLAQVAAFADRQLVVSRAASGDGSQETAVTESNVFEVTGQERVREIARMMSGQPQATAALAHAQELLAVAQSRVD